VKAKRLIAIGAAVLCTAGSLLAHHSITAVFDTTKRIKLVGELTEVGWVNPHIFLKVKGKIEGGPVVEWKVEGSPPAFYRRAGASSTTFSKRIGQTVTIDGLPSKNGAVYGYLQKITFADGDTLESASAADAQAAERGK
jgi:hypothetical protein